MRRCEDAWPSGDRAPEPFGVTGLGSASRQSHERIVKGLVGSAGRIDGIDGGPATSPISPAP